MPQNYCFFVNCANIFAILLEKVLFYLIFVEVLIFHYLFRICYIRLFFVPLQPFII